eukprot:jgi/Undpi1/4737/HiC_scaffold_18.g08090.m1
MQRSTGGRHAAPVMIASRDELQRRARLRAKLAAERIAKEQQEERKKHSDIVRRKANAKAFATRAREENAVRPAARSRSANHASDNAGGKPEDHVGSGAGRNAAGHTNGHAAGAAAEGGEGVGAGRRGGHPRARSSPPGRAPQRERTRSTVSSVGGTAAVVVADGFRRGGGGGGGGDVNVSGGRGRVRDQPMGGDKSGFRVGFGSGVASTRGASRSQPAPQRRRQGETGQSPQRTLRRRVLDGGINVGGVISGGGEGGDVEPRAAATGAGRVSDVGTGVNGRGRGAGEREMGVRDGRGRGRSAGTGRRAVGTGGSREPSGRRTSKHVSSSCGPSARPVAASTDEAAARQAREKEDMELQKAKEKRHNDILKFMARWVQ